MLETFTNKLESISGLKTSEVATCIQESDIVARLKRSERLKSYCETMCPTNWYETLWPTTFPEETVGMWDLQAHYLEDLTGIHYRSIQAAELTLLSGAAMCLAYGLYKRRAATLNQPSSEAEKTKAITLEQETQNTKPGSQAKNMAEKVVEPTPAIKVTASKVVVSAKPVNKTPTKPAQQKANPVEAAAVKQPVQKEKDARTKPVVFSRVPTDHSNRGPKVEAAQPLNAKQKTPNDVMERLKRMGARNVMVLPSIQKPRP